MGYSRRGNYMLASYHESEVTDPNNDARGREAEAEWAAQWEPTIPCTHDGQHPQQARPAAAYIELTGDSIILRAGRTMVRIALVA
jgi:hypothetical protein